LHELSAFRERSFAYGETALPPSPALRANRHAGLAGAGAVTLIQRFGSALNLNPHLHMLFLDGAYVFRGRRPTFHRARRPDNDELNQLLDTLSRRIVRVLERRGLLIADPEHPHLDLEPGSSLDHLQAASIAYRVAIGPHAGRKALTLYSVPPVEETSNHPLLAKRAGFSLHAASVCEAWQRRQSGHGGLRAESAMEGVRFRRRRRSAPGMPIARARSLADVPSARVGGNSGSSHASRIRR
jgi:hypothetical protein